MAVAIKLENPPTPWPSACEATIIIGKRARQIISERIARNQIVTFDRDTELEETDFSEQIEPEIEYEEMIKATSEALVEFLNGELKWDYAKEELS